MPALVSVMLHRNALLALGVLPCGLTPRYAGTGASFVCSAPLLWPRTVAHHAPVPQHPTWVHHAAVAYHVTLHKPKFLLLLRGQKLAYVLHRSDVDQPEIRLF